MSEQPICCSGCFRKIGLKSTACARLWLDLCEIDFGNGLFAIKGIDFPALRFLELWGFLTTTDRPQDIVVKMNGRQADHEDAFYCLGGCDE
jgi:hypothetical protein